MGSSPPHPWRLSWGVTSHPFRAKLAQYFIIFLLNSFSSSVTSTTESKRTRVQVRANPSPAHGSAPTTLTSPHAALPLVLFCPPWPGSLPTPPTSLGRQALSSPQLGSFLTEKAPFFLLTPESYLRNKYACETPSSAPMPGIHGWGGERWREEKPQSKKS